MPNALTKKIELARNIYCYALAFVVLLALIAIYRPSYKFDVSINNSKIFASVVTTAAQQQKGLGGLASLPSGSGMLFAFHEPAERGIWMKGMNFAIDVVWIGGDGKVVKVDKNVVPETYPEVFSAENAQFILEIPSGDVDKIGIVAGQQVIFSWPSAQSAIIKTWLL